MRKIKFAFITLFLILCSSVFAEDWFVCLASFKQKNNAEALVKNLANNNVGSFIAEQTVKGQLYYRVLYKTDYPDAVTARRHRDELKNNETLKKYKLSGFWICQAVTSTPSAKSVPVEEPKTVILQKTEKSSIPISEEKPYSLKINSYKEEQAAVSDKKRLEDKNIDSYIVKSYDDKTYFNFDLHAGAFETPEQAEPLIKKIEDAGLPEPKLSDYNEIKESIEKYNSVVEAQEIRFQDGNTTIPETITPQVRKLIQQFPINRDFQIEEILICDMDNVRKFNTDLPDDFKELYLDSSELHASTLTTYHDSLYDKKIGILMCQADSGCFEKLLNDINQENAIQFAIKDDIINAYILEKDSDQILVGFNPDFSLMIMMISSSFSKAEYEAFINNFDNDSNLLIYPQIRKSLLVLPDESAQTKRDFVFFYLSKVSDDYPSEKGFAKWSLPIPGHWKATGVFNQNNDELRVSFFDLDYDFNAKKIHQIFMDDHNSQSQNSTNHASTLELAESWYVSNFFGDQELSFSTNSYIVAVDAYTGGSINEEELLQMSRDLKIWNSIPQKATEINAK